MHTVISSLKLVIDSKTALNYNGIQTAYMYEGHLRINDNEFISRKVLLYSVLFIMPHEDTYNPCSCLKFCAFIMTRFDAMNI